MVICQLLGAGMDVWISSLCPFLLSDNSQLAIFLGVLVEGVVAPGL